MIADQTGLAGLLPRNTFGFDHCLMERPVKIGNHLVPLLAAVGNAVKFGFGLGREFEVHNPREVFNQKVGYQSANRSRQQLIAVGPGDLGVNALLI